MSTRVAHRALDQITEVAMAGESKFKALAYTTLSNRGIRPSKEDIEDVLSEAFLDAARRCFRDPVRLAKPEVWFRRVVFHRCLRFLRGRAQGIVERGMLDGLKDDAELQLAVETWDPHRKLLAQQLSSEASTEDREILRRFSEGWTSSDIGEHLGLSPSTIRKRMSRALDSLRQLATRSNNDGAKVLEVKTT